MITFWPEKLQVEEQMSESNLTHEPVMLKEILEVLPLTPGAVIADGTLGLGGHAIELAKRIAPGGTLIGFDWDIQMLRRAEARLEGSSQTHFKYVNEDFRQMASVLEGLEMRANGVLLDLGINSAQVDDASRGLSFKQDGPLDMRMDTRKGETAASLLGRLSLKQIEDILWNYGDERWARAIAKQIVDTRDRSPLRTTQDLVDVIHQAVPPKARDKRIHPATRTFMALRIAVNHELDGLGEALDSIAGRLAPNGVIAVLSYHSGEDRIVKESFKKLALTGDFEELFRKPMVPSDAEQRTNSRSRSAKFRALRRSPRVKMAR